MITQGIFSYIRNGILLLILLIVDLRVTTTQIVSAQTSTTPAAVSQVTINEIAWMGTSDSSNAEWIELYNYSDESVVLDGWVIHAYDGSPKINLVGSIDSQGYYLLERTNDATVPTVLADSIYSGSLGNTGERLQLIDSRGTVIEDLDFTVDGWPAGDNTTKDTMQRDGESWITGGPTPGAQNSTRQEAEHDGSDSETGNSNTSPSTPPTSESMKTKKESVTLVAPDPKYSTKLTIPEYGVVGVPIPIKAVVTQDGKRDLVTGRFEWYLGDGGTHRYYQNTPFEYQYLYPGEYTVVLEYYSNSLKEEIDSIHQKKIVIIPDLISIDSLTHDGGITISNTSTRDIDLGGWSLRRGDLSFLVPKYTISKKGGRVTIPNTVHHLNITQYSSPVTLHNPTGQVVSVFEYGMLAP